ncbi:Dipeptide transport system permease protein DppB [Nocardioides aquaticus]|jgi:peptide/nickel transport system permease protein|uniref:Dipeptide transport system permease protein DppB n=1 Tax=Nocardioides aquaticus TaxID=160826 RepID=A0ABX8EJT8_9ACTN|nr:ABC transporter permease [Nocardioides aquaticus]QVT80377.1 Dipeptide transport system permease protein DppB [Nocardioides aquaticus]
MLGFIVRRVLTALLVVLLTSIFVFVLLYKGVANPAGPVCDAQGRCTAERLAAIEEQMGLNDPILTQYGEFATGVFAGRTVSFGETAYDCPAPCLGVSYGTRGLITDELVERLPATISLAIGASIIYLVVGVTLGVLAAKVRGTATDRLLVSSSLVVSSIPYYLFCLMAYIFLVLKTPIFDETGYLPITESVGAWFFAMLLPWLVLGLFSSSNYARFTRGQMVETLGEDYIRTASAKGVSPNKVVFGHGLRAAIVPIVTIFGLDFAALLGGTIFTEKIFQIDGIGLWALDAVTRPPLDFPVVIATVLVVAIIITLANLVVDIVYGFLDPRVRIS